MTESVSIVSRLISGVSRSTDSYVRTDVRTDGDSDFPPVDIFPVRYAQESGPELARFEDAAERLPALANRYPVIRTGPREPILWPVRLGVYLRDGSRCQLCGYWIRHGEPNLDHIVPWSAGGPDTSDNLRTLCAPCNERRSNYDHGATGKRVLPVTLVVPGLLDHRPPAPRVARLRVASAGRTARSGATHDVGLLRQL